MLDSYKIVVEGKNYICTLVSVNTLCPVLEMILHYLSRGLDCLVSLLAFFFFFFNMRIEMGNSPSYRNSRHPIPLF